MTTATRNQKNSVTYPAPTPAAEPAPASLLDQVIDKTVERLDSLSQQCLEALAAPAASALRRAMLRARAVELLEAAITPEVLRLIMRLMNSPAGFLTDRGPGMKQEAPYDATIVRRCAVEALLAGVTWYDNEFNIISGKLYIALAGYRRKVHEYPGLTDCEVIPGTPTVHNGHTVVRVAARWKLNGRDMEFTDATGEPGIVFPVSTNQYSTADNTLGKAKRKAYRLIYERVSGTAQSDPDDETPLLDQAVGKAPRRSRTQETAELVTQRAGRKTDEQNQVAEAPTPEQYQQQAPATEVGAGTSDPEPGAEGNLYPRGDSFEGPHGDRR